MEGKVRLAVRKHRRWKEHLAGKQIHGKTAGKQHELSRYIIRAARLCKIQAWPQVVILYHKGLFLSSLFWRQFPICSFCAFYVFRDILTLCPQLSCMTSSKSVWIRWLHFSVVLMMTWMKIMKAHKDSKSQDLHTASALWDQGRCSSLGWAV